jgi:hypothetical protein
VFLESDTSAFFLWLSTDTHISSVVDRPIHCWIIIRQCSSYSIILWVLPLTHNAFTKLYSLNWTTMLYFWACVVYSWSLWYMFLRCPVGLNQYFP